MRPAPEIEADTAEFEEIADWVHLKKRVSARYPEQHQAVLRWAAALMASRRFALMRWIFFRCFFAAFRVFLFIDPFPDLNVPC